MTDRTALVAEKDAFAKRLAEAIRTQSLEGLMALLPSFEQVRASMDLPPEPSRVELLRAKAKSQGRMIADRNAHRKWQRKEAEGFLARCQDMWSEFPDRMAAFTAHEARAIDLRDLYVLPETGTRIQEIRRLRVMSTPVILENGDVSQLRVQITPVLTYINGHLVANTFSEARCSEIIDSSARIAAGREALGFVALSTEAYRKRMAGQAWQFMDETANYAWMIHEGDLTLRPEDIKQMVGGAFLITGDLTIDGLCDFDDSMAVFVLGDLHCKALFLGSSDFYVSGTVHAELSVHVHGGSGAPVQIGAIEAPFVYNDADAFSVLSTDTERVPVFHDSSFGKTKGDLLATLKPEFLSIDPEEIGGSIYVKSEDMIRALKAGEDVFLPGFLDNR